MSSRWLFSWSKKIKADSQVTIILWFSRSDHSPYKPLLLWMSCMFSPWFSFLMCEKSWINFPFLAPSLQSRALAMTISTAAWLRDQTSQATSMLCYAKSEAIMEMLWRCRLQYSVILFLLTDLLQGRLNLRLYSTSTKTICSSKWLTIMNENLHLQFSFWANRIFVAWHMPWNFAFLL